MLFTKGHNSTDVSNHIELIDSGVVSCGNSGDPSFVYTSDAMLFTKGDNSTDISKHIALIDSGVVSCDNSRNPS